MELPNKARAYISPEKISGYLLSETHAVGKSKAKYFRSYGFHPRKSVDLEHGLLAIARQNPVNQVESSPHGTKYSIEGELKTPKGFMIRVRTVWIIETGQKIPRFVTAYPVEKENPND
jgi:hypothetical protein